MLFASVCALSPPAPAFKEILYEARRKVPTGVLRGEMWEAGWEGISTRSLQLGGRGEMGKGSQGDGESLNNLLEGKIR